MSLHVPLLASGFEELRGSDPPEALQGDPAQRVGESLQGVVESWEQLVGLVDLVFWEAVAGSACVDLRTPSLDKIEPGVLLIGTARIDWVSH